jgi:hypothetical protein
MQASLQRRGGCAKLARPTRQILQVATASQVPVTRANVIFTRARCRRALRPWGCRSGDFLELLGSGIQTQEFSPDNHHDNLGNNSASRAEGTTAPTTTRSQKLGRFTEKCEFCSRFLNALSRHLLRRNCWILWGTDAGSS